MKTLPLDVARCSGVIRWTSSVGDEMPEHDTCLERETCQRFLAFTRWDREAGIPDFRGLWVSVAVENCGHKIPADDIAD